MKPWEREIQVVVRALVLRGDRALVVRSNSQPRPGTWGFPGGFLEPNETLAQAAERELREETGLAGRTVGLVGVSNRRLDGKAMVSLLILMSAPDGDPRPDPDEVDRAEFVAVADLPRILGPAVRWMPSLHRILAGGRPLAPLAATDDGTVFGLEAPE